MYYKLLINQPQEQTR